MTQEQEQAKKDEPVEVARDENFMDTGVLHEPPKSKGVRGQHVQRPEKD